MINIRWSLEVFIKHKSQSSLTNGTLGVGGESYNHSPNINQHAVYSHFSPSKIASEVCHFWLSKWIRIQSIKYFIHTSPPQKLHTRLPFFIEHVNKNTLNHVVYSLFSPSKIAYDVCHFWMSMWIKIRAKMSRSTWWLNEHGESMKHVVENGQN